MTEKRFILDDDFEWWGIIDTSGRIRENEYSDRISGQIVVDLLNRLNDENEELKGDLEYWKNRFKEEEWHYEHIDEDRDVWHYKCTQLEKENERLRNGIELLQEENDDLNKFFLHNCKTSEYLKWKKRDVE